MIKRAFDILVSIIGISILLLPFAVIAIIIKLDSKGPVLFKQVRVGRNGREFRILKFRTMVTDAESLGKKITVGGDSRITRAGRYLRKCKADELPQLFNVFVGDMSFVGPRPEVPEYVRLYTEEQRKVLSVRPGITDYASKKFRNENDLLTNCDDPEKLYIEKIMPIKLQLNLQYIEKQSLWVDISLIIGTILSLFKGGNDDEEALSD